MNRPKRYQKNVSAKQKYQAYENVFDESTLSGLHKLSGQGYFEDLKSPIKIGKEANVFTATKGDGLVVVKIYRKSDNFKKMYDYMAPDPRFAGLKRNKVYVIYTWAKKEYRNLLRARSVGVKVPTPYAVYKNILVMEYIGGKQPAPQINRNFPAGPGIFYETLIKDIIKLYREAELVHGDLSEFNILNLDDKPVIIDLSHAVDLKYPNVKDLLRRDISIIVKYFKKLGVKLDEGKEFERCTSKN